MPTKIALEAARTAYVESLKRLATAVNAVVQTGPTLWDYQLENAIESRETHRAAYIEAHRADRAAGLRRSLPKAE